MYHVSILYSKHIENKMFQALNTSGFQDVVHEAREDILSLRAIVCKLVLFFSFLSPSQIKAKGRSQL